MIYKNSLSVAKSPYAGNFILDLKERENMHLYYAIKNRFDYKITEANRAIFINNISIIIQKYCQNFHFEYIIIPESSQSFLEDTIKETKIPYYVLAKNSKTYILNNIDCLDLQKHERDNHIKRINEMGESFKINHLKANQRRKYSELLFDKRSIKNLSGRGLIIDDSYFSGITIIAMQKATCINDYLSIFAK